MPTASDRVTEDDGERSGPEAGRTAAGPGSTPRPICIACQRPIDEARDRQWRGEPVHFECGAALRCGVDLGDPPSE